MKGTEGTPEGKDEDEVLIVDAEYSPGVEREIDLDVEGGVLPVEQKVNAPDVKGQADPEILAWFVSGWNSICTAHGCTDRVDPKLFPADVPFFSAKPKVTLDLALFYLRRNKKFPNYPITFNTLRKEGKIEKYAGLGAMDMAMDFSDKSDKGEPGTPAPAQAPQPSPGPAPRAKAVAAAQAIPEALVPAWERLKAIVVPKKKRVRPEDWEKLQAVVTPKDPAEAIIDRYSTWVEAWRATRASDEDDQYCPCFRFWLERDDHLLTPPKIPTKTVAKAEGEYREAKEKALAAGKTSTFDPNFNNAAALAALLKG